MLEECSFGSMVIDSRKFTSGLIIYPDGRVVDSWWRDLKLEKKGETNEKHCTKSSCNT